MTTRRPLTAQIKPATRNAIMDQLAVAADEIMAQRMTMALWEGHARRSARRRWWHRLMWWRA